MKNNNMLKQEMFKAYDNFINKLSKLDIYNLSIEKQKKVFDLISAMEDFNINILCEDLKFKK